MTLDFEDDETMFDDDDYDYPYEEMCDCEDCCCLNPVPERGMICDDCRVGKHFGGLSKVANGS